MNKLTNFLFTHPIARDVVPVRGSERILLVRRRPSPGLVCVWAPDPETGRLVCSWTKPTDEDGSLTRDAGEPPALRIAA